MSDLDFYGRNFVSTIYSKSCSYLQSRLQIIEVAGKKSFHSERSLESIQYTIIRLHSKNSPIVSKCPWKIQKKTVRIHSLWFRFGLDFSLVLHKRKMGRSRTVTIIYYRIVYGCLCAFVQMHGTSSPLECYVCNELCCATQCIYLFFALFSLPSNRNNSIL